MENNSTSAFQAMLNFYSSLGIHEKYLLFIGIIIVIFSVALFIKNHKYKKLLLLNSKIEEKIQEMRFQVIESKTQFIDCHQKYVKLLEKNKRDEELRQFYKEKKLEEQKQKELEELAKKDQEFDEMIFKLSSKGTIKYKPSINKDEYVIYWELIKLNSYDKRIIVSFQASMKAFLKVDDKEQTLWKAYSNLYVDFLISRIGDSKSGEKYKLGKVLWPEAVIEFNGSGHFAIDNIDNNDEKAKKEAILRKKRNDFLKLSSLRNAGIPFLVIEGKDVYDENSIIDQTKLHNIVDSFGKDLIENKKGLLAKNIEYLEILRKDLNL